MACIIIGYTLAVCSLIARLFAEGTTQEQLSNKAYKRVNRLICFAQIMALILTAIGVTQ